MAGCCHLVVNEDYYHLNNDSSMIKPQGIVSITFVTSTTETVVDKYCEPCFLVLIKCFVSWGWGSQSSRKMRMCLGQAVAYFTSQTLGGERDADGMIYQHCSLAAKVSENVHLHFY